MIKREARLEAALRAATRLRKAVEGVDDKRILWKAFLIKREAVEAYDAEIERIKKLE